MAGVTADSQGRVCFALEDEAVVLAIRVRLLGYSTPSPFQPTSYDTDFLNSNESVGELNSIANLVRGNWMHCRASENCKLLFSMRRCTQYWVARKRSSAIYEVDAPVISVVFQVLRKQGTERVLML